MRTWKQGVVGILPLNNRTIFIKCLKYPLAVFYKNFNNENSELENKLFSVFLDLSVLKHIHKITELKLSLEEKKIGQMFTLDNQTRALTLDNALQVLNTGLITLEEIMELIKERGYS